MTPALWSAIFVSVQVGVWSMSLGLPIALLCGWILARWRFSGKGILSGFVLAPMVLPPVITGYLLLDIGGRRGVLGAPLQALGWPLSFSFSGAVIAATIIGLPLYIWAIRAAFEAVDPRLEQLSWTLGVPPRATFWRVTFPLAAPGIAAGMVLAFARGLGEFGATIVFAGDREGETRTIALATYQLLELPNSDSEIRILILASLVLGGFGLMAYELLLRWQRRRLEWE